MLRRRSKRQKRKLTIRNLLQKVFEGTQNKKKGGERL